MTLRKFFSLLCVPILLAGCSTTVTNLTPRQTTRNSNGLYLFSVMLDSNQQSLRRDSIKPYVIIGSEAYPMQPIPMLQNRWEAYVPVPPNEGFVHYRYKFDYLYNRIPQPQASSKLSDTYQLQILDK
ncbi:MAG: hypothetical protein AB1813_23410 [Verrucomicrobiota bacterium]|jgi:hypothetical protein